MVWYRNDLRLHDHEPLHQAIRTGAQVIPLYCFDPRHFATTAFGFPKTGAFRGQFLLESVADLRHALKQLGSTLLIRQGLPEVIIPAIAQQVSAQAVFCHQEVTAEEVAVEAAVQRVLATLGIQFQAFWGATLYHPDDLPFRIDQLPELFSTFRKQVEKTASVKPVLHPPSRLPAVTTLEAGELPTLAQLGLEAAPLDPRAVLPFKGGETAGQARVQDYFWTQDQLQHYKQTRNGLLGANYSSKFSPWLAAGCLSPRWIYEQVKTYERERVRNDSTYWLIFELLWRDFFQLICAKHGNRIFYPSGLQGLKITWQEDWSGFRRWQTGQTGFPFVDANMRELAATGFISNRGRQNVASFLTKNLGINWQMGAEWFESQLIDYDVCSNWGNWNYLVGIGNDARGFRYFNLPKQSQLYDPKGDYIKHWIPELAKVPGDKIHQPERLTTSEQTQYQCQIGVDYPHPMVDLVQSAHANENRYTAALAARSH
jgi:deoxyribodipyrimidine photo-lyase